MSDAAAAKKPKAKKEKKAATHPKYNDMIAAAIKSLAEKGGSSRQAILKYISDHYSVGKDSKVVNTHLKLALKRGVKAGVLKQAKGSGASGSFKLADKAKASAEKKTKTKKSPKKPAAVKPKKATTPKKKPAAKKSPAKKAAKKSPKKAAKPKAAAKKSPAKKAAKPKAKKATPKKGKK